MHVADDGISKWSRFDTIKLISPSLYDCFINLFLKKNVNYVRAKKKCFLMIHAGYEGSDHCKKSKEAGLAIN